MSTFREQVILYIQSIPAGKVISYGQAAAAAGSPRAARQVGGILRALSRESGVPWWRVINNQGVISIKGHFEATKELQKNLLQKEGVLVRDGFSIEIEKYRYLK